MGLGIMMSMTTTDFLNSISEPCEEIPAERIISCPVCTGDRDFDDPADCPECAGSRTVAL